MPEGRSTSRVTIIDVARQAGVSISTVSRVINQTAPISRETEQRVRAVIEELHYVPHLPARQLASRRIHTLGLILEEIARDFYLPMLRGIEVGAREAGYDLLIATQGNREASAIGEHNTAGALVFADSLEEAELRRLHNSGFRMVLLLHAPPADLPIPCVTFENKGGARRMTDHLIETCGYRHIAFLRGPQGNQDSGWREKGYRASLRAHGIPYRPRLTACGGFDEQQAQAAVEQLLADGVDMEAIFAADDESAIGAMLALKRAGLRVPQDVAVVGFDDIPMARYVTPSLTTVHAPIEQAGYEAVRQLVSLIENGSAEPLVLLPTEVVIRESCGCGKGISG